jgi:predicted GNAT family N-acyltransferase
LIKINYYKISVIRGLTDVGPFYSRKSNQRYINMDNIIIKEIAYSTPAYESEVALRDKILRKPLGMSLYNEDLTNEKQDTHIGAFLDNSLVGVLILTKLESNDYKMRQVAVDDTMQGKGTGKKLVEFAEAFAIKTGAKKMVLHARKTAIPFYEKLGYQTEGNEFLEVNILHKKMFKLL